MTLRYFVRADRLAELTIPDDITTEEKERLLKHLQLDLQESE